MEIKLNYVLMYREGQSCTYTLWIFLLEDIFVYIVVIDNTTSNFKKEEKPD